LESKSSEALIEWGAHLSVGAENALATVSGPIGYGVGRGSAQISGGPYHVILVNAAREGIGSRNNQIQGAGILVSPAAIVIIKDAAPENPQDFSFTTTGTGLSSFIIDDDGETTILSTLR
jgi:hypothetical protein